MIQVKSALRRVPFQHVTSILFLLVTAVLLAGGLGHVVRGARLSVFVPVGATAALIGWGLGTRRFNGGLAWVGMVLLGIAVLWGSTAQFGGPLLRLADALPALLYQVVQWVWDRKFVPDFSAAASVWLDLLTQSTGLWLRVMFWVQSYQRGENRYDPVIYVLAWSFLLWLVAAWEGWFIRREQVMTASVPSLVLLAEVIYITGAELTSLWVMLWITLLLMGLTHFRIIFASWMKRGIDYAEIILDTTIAFILTFTLLLAVASWVVPSISIQNIIDRIREYTTPPPAQTGQSLAEQLGLEAVSAKGTAVPTIYATTPDLHVIGPGPVLSRDLVMSISTGEILPGQAFQPVTVPYHRWRSNTMDRYTGDGWANTLVIKTPYEANTPIFTQIPAQYRILRQTVRLANQPNQRLYWDGILQSVDQPFDVGWRTSPPSRDTPFTDADMLGAFSTAKIYQVTSLLVVMDEKQLKAAQGMYDEAIRKRYLDLPESVPERVLALARQITATAPTPYDQARALETYLRNTYPYTLHIPAPPVNRDVVDYFLFDLKKGFCDYYATSMVVMARSIGLPARIVFGYGSGTYDQAKGEYDVVLADSHAWVEVYFTSVGWVEFDPTANQPEVDRLLESDPSANQANSGSQPLMAFYQNFAPGFIRWSILGAIGLVALVILFQLGEFWLLTNIPTVRAMQMIYRGLYRVGRNVVGPTTAGETTDEFATLLGSQLTRLSQKRLLQNLLAPAQNQLNLLTDLYSRAIYTPRPPEKTEIRAALQVWQALRWRLLLAGVATIVNRLFDYGPWRVLPGKNVPSLRD